MSNRIVSAAYLVGWLMAALPAQAENFVGGCYKLVHGAENPVCRKLVQNLNRFCQAPPMRCEIRIHPDFAKDFTFPKWEDLDPQVNIELIAELVRSRALVAHDCTGECDARWRELKWQEYRPKLLEGIKAGRIRFSRVRVDINQDGQKELVFRLMDTGCSLVDEEPNYSYGNPALMVLDEVTGKFDRGFDRHLKSGVYDVLLHQGRVSLIEYNRWDDQWEIYEPVSGPGVGRFAVIHRPVCEYRILKGRGK